MISYSIDQYRQLCDMIAKGVTSLEQNGEKVTFRSLDEMRRLKAEMERVLGLAARPQVHYPVYRKA